MLQNIFRKQIQQDLLVCWLWGMNRKEELGIISRFLARYLFGLWSHSSEMEKTTGEREGVGSSWEANGEYSLGLVEFEMSETSKEKC